MVFDRMYHVRFGSQPGWGALVAEESARLLFSLMNHLSTTHAWRLADLPARRRLITDTVASGQYPDILKRDLLGPVVFDSNRARNLPLLMGIYLGGELLSAPVQITSMPPAPIHYQTVVHTGLYLNSIPDIDIKRKQFSADFYRWMRYLSSGDTAVDPSDIAFLGMLDGLFDHNSPVESVINENGEVYKLWRERATFSNALDLFLYPFHRQ